MKKNDNTDFHFTQVDSNKRNKIRTYLDEKVTNVNREIDRRFYDDKDGLEEDVDLYNMTDSTPIMDGKERQ